MPGLAVPGAAAGLLEAVLRDALERWRPAPARRSSAAERKGDGSCRVLDAEETVGMESL